MPSSASDRTIDPPPTGVTTLPQGGLTHPVFAHAGPEDSVRVTVCFEPGLDPDQLTQVRQLVWLLKSFADARASQGQAFGGNSFWLADYGLSILLEQQPRPAKLADLLMDELRQLSLPIKELTFNLLRDDPEIPIQWNMMYPVKPAAPHPDDPRGPDTFPDFQSYWEAV